MKFASILFIFATLSLCLATQVDKHRHHDRLFVVLSDSECKHNKLVSSLLRFGSDHILGSACTSDELLLASDFRVDQIHEVSRWADKTKAHYKYAVRYVHAKIADLYIEAKFTIEYCFSGDATAIIFSDFNIHFDECASWVSAYKVIPSRQYRDSLLQELLGHGNEFICESARHRNQIARLPSAISHFDVLAVNKIAYRKLDDIAYYRYDVCLGDHGHKSYKIDATFVVMVCRSTGKFSVVAVEYKIVDLIDNTDCDQSDCRSDSECSSDSDSESCKTKSDCSSDSECSDKKKECSDNDSDCSSDSSDRKSHYSRPAQNSNKWNGSNKNSNKRDSNNKNSVIPPVASPAGVPSAKATVAPSKTQ